MYLVFARPNRIIFVLKSLRSKIINCGKYNLLNDKYFFIYPSDFFQIQHSLSTSAFVKNVHTTKGWKTIARTGQKIYQKDMLDLLPLSCEEGTDAVPHSDLMNKLKNCNTVSEQIETFCSSVSITSKDIETRKQFCNSLIEMFSPYFPKFKIHQFGSSLNGLGFKGCDIDVSIQTIFDDKSYVKHLEAVPTLDSVIEGHITADDVAHLTPLYLLRLVRRILRRDCSDVREPILLIKARCPILRFYNTKYDLFCDFSCENKASLRNTQLMRIICLIEERFATLTKLIRYWGKYGGFVGDIDMFNSYSFSLLVVHFLQHTNPPVLPPLKEVIENSDYLNYGDVIDDELLFKDVKKFEKSKNTQSVEELLREYFFYFLNFDFSKMMMPFSSSIIPVTSFAHCEDGSLDTFEFSTVNMQDPFRKNYNVTFAATYKNCKKFRNACLETCKVYQDNAVWDSKSEMWGICSLFYKRRSDHEVQKKGQENHIHRIKLQHKAKGTLVKEILQQGLLFECIEFYVHDDQVPRPSLKLNCKVCEYTWQGRDWIRQTRPPSLTDILEIEKWVSTEILQSRGGNKNRVLFTFSCECYESDNELNIVLSFKDPKCLPNLAIFLKEYIPSMYRKLCIN